MQPNGSMFIYFKRANNWLLDRLSFKAKFKFLFPCKYYLLFLLSIFYVNIFTYWYRLTISYNKHC